MENRAVGTFLFLWFAQPPFVLFLCWLSFSTHSTITVHKDIKQQMQDWRARGIHTQNTDKNTGDKSVLQDGKRSCTVGFGLVIQLST
jgi:hypothetical protein